MENIAMGFQGAGRTNCFRVKDEDAFRREVMALPGLEHHTREIDGTTFHMLTECSDDGAGWTTQKESHSGEWTDIDLVDLLSKHVRDGDVAILMESGCDERRYISGWAIAVNSKGETRRVNIGDIYSLAKDLGESVTEVCS